MGVGGPLERKGFRDDGLQAAGAQLGEQHLHQRRELRALLPQMADVQAEDAAVAVDQRQRIEASESPATRGSASTSCAARPVAAAESPNITSRPSGASIR